MKILVFGRGIPTKQNNMRGSFEFEQAVMLAKAGHTVFYPALDLRSFRRWRKWGYAEKVIDGVHTVTLNVPIGKLLPGRMHGILARKWLRRWVNMHVSRAYGSPDIVHVHYPALWPYEYVEGLQKQGAKIVGTEHWTKVQDKTLPDVCADYLKEFVSKADAVLCVGTPLKNSIMEITGTEREIQVVPNIVPDMFSYEAEKAAPMPPFRFVAAGRLVECKRFDLLIEAFAEAFGENPDVVLDIIGGGDQRELLENLILKNSCGDRVHLLGVMNREEIAQYYKKCHALVLSSNLETFGVPVIEAWACGMPVVTTDAIGFLEYTNEANSIVIEQDNKEQLAAAMQKLYSNYKNYDRQQIADYAGMHFSEAAICGGLMRVYHAVTSEEVPHEKQDPNT